MLKIADPPAKPGNFDNNIATAQANIQTIIDANNRPRSSDFDDKWGAFKGSFTTAQHDKCGYCELWLSSHPGDVEHYRPKATIQELPADESRWGSEGDGVYNVSGRSLDTVSQLGYWWLAYSWENYLAACNRCNSGWKRNLFIVEENPRPNPQPGMAETPLLLNPFFGEDPSDHLEFDSIGQTKAHNDSEYGKTTINICGLDRPSLVRARFEKARNAHRLLDEYADANSVNERRQVIKRFIEMGLKELSFAGMVRAIFRQNLQLDWDNYEAQYHAGNL